MGCVMHVEGGQSKMASVLKIRNLLTGGLLRELVPKAIPIGVDNERRGEGCRRVAANVTVRLL